MIKMTKTTTENDMPAPAEINIKTLTITELKALAYDQYLLRDQANNNINVIIRELDERARS